MPAFAVRRTCRTTVARYIQRLPQIEELQKQKEGTIVLWDKLDKIFVGDDDKEQGLLLKIKEVEEHLYSQYPFYDIYQNARFADFVLENGATRVAIEIDDEASHNPRLVSQDKFYDDLLKQNSMIHLGWDVYRWAVRQMQKQPETVKDELRVFLGSDPRFKEIEDYLPTQQGRALKADQLELREYQQEAMDSLEAMRQNRETIALLYHATGTGKTVTAVMDAKRCGGRVLFVAHTMELVNQAYNTFRDLWPEARTTSKSRTPM